MKRFMLLALIFGLAPPALAVDCGDMCIDGNVEAYKITIGGNANFGGFGSGMFIGQEGGVKVEKIGFGNTDVKMNIGGSLCGLNCQDGSFSFAANAGESVKVLTGALSTTSGESAMAVNEGAAFSNATAIIQFIRPATTPPR
ncbi:MAG: hypothetical protein KBC35_03995 [Candidatus Pacebacteria bacterium]|nr:hypothetical protein [Candidatus Paceibacterota bacterium]